MGGTVSNPLAFRRAIVSLHYKEHPLSGDAGDLELFWRALFCTWLSDEQLASFWTAEDVRLLRMYRPGRLAAVLIASMQQLEALIALSCEAAAELDPGNSGDVGENPSGGGLATVKVEGAMNYMQPQPSLRRREGRALNPCAALNALRLIGGALPYCFEDIEELTALLREDADATARGGRIPVIVSQRTRELMDVANRTESPYAADFAYHFFFRGEFCPSPPQTSPGTQLVELYLKLLFMPGVMTAAVPCRDTEPRQEPSHASSEAAFNAELLLLLRQGCVSPALLFSLVRGATPADVQDRLANNQIGGSSSSNVSPEINWSRAQPAFALGSDYHAIILRTLLLLLSGPIYAPAAEVGPATAGELEKRNCSKRRREATSALMASELFDGEKQSLAAVLCASLLYTVRFYAKKSTTPSSYAAVFSKRPRSLAAHTAVLGHALAILAMGIYSGPSILCSDPQLPVPSESRVSNVFFSLVKAVLDRAETHFSADSDTATSQQSSIHLPDQLGHGETDSLSYARSLVEAMLILLENPLRASVEKDPQVSIPCAPLVLHLLLWVMQQSQVALDIIGGRPYSFMAFIHSILVSSKVSLSRFGEGQLSLLCLLILLRRPSFLKLLATRLPSHASGATATEVEKFMRVLRVAMPMLPQSIRITADSDGEGTFGGEKDSDTLCLYSYGNLLVLAMCYVLSPSSPRWFRPLYRSAVEVLHTLQVVFTHATLIPNVCLRRHVLNEHVMLELVSSLAHLSSRRVLRLGTEPQRACLKMIHVLLALIQSTIGPVQNADGSWCSAARRVGELDGMELVPLLWKLAVGDSLRALAGLTSTAAGPWQEEFGAEAESAINAEEVILEDSMSFSNPFTIPKGERGGMEPPTTVASGAAGVSSTVTSLHDFARQLLNSKEFNKLYRIVSAVRVGLNNEQERPASVSHPTVDFGGEDLRGPMMMSPAGSLPVSRRICRDPEGCQFAWAVLQNAAAVLDEIQAHEREDEEAGGGRVGDTYGLKEKGSGAMLSGGVTIARRLVIDSGGTGRRWLLVQLWRQVHMFNLSPAMFDYRSTLIM
ncbi:hypothetical protein TraAM80_02960 [Trypanosoma rangeli]|uniref:Uncharacterized protein n=1 Tax=Trypanosoma rangeli TaxID=5698 RepID=A0A3R7L5H4_TRYRA|nr:uncharacterized protein TraAM80_02960 [Trypanosoma rangeli]RNF08027.1 hypothetical protein TraAM80_02960 [Trypanosoma rangeli]|eukprot:RNF08027.1 hypothetical protein TraAM80_02960 [Trypanosoma rangeli]